MTNTVLYDRIRFVKQAVMEQSKATDVSRERTPRLKAFFTGVTRSSVPELSGEPTLAMIANFPDVIKSAAAEEDEELLAS